jgi:hypothetical protein
MVDDAVLDSDCRRYHMVTPAAEGLRIEKNLLSAGIIYFKKSFFYEQIFIKNCLKKNCHV